MNESNFESWAIIEVFGHDKYAGFVSSQTIGNESMVKIEVPEVQNQEVNFPPFQKLFNVKSIFSITPVSEEYAFEMAKTLSKHPIEGYEHKQVIKTLAKSYFDNMKMEEVKKLLVSANGAALIEPDENPETEW